ncbi:MAG: protein kinase [Pyrinomonadaceae bacterium]|nr:protein kinase [Pyrinomonadaceae bacterium]MBP6213517.1 protein kinase [Pyrinomonadaceae bacterium]
MRECPKCELCFADEVTVCPTDGTQTKVTLPGGQLLASRYLLESRLGRGAMGQVYLARDKKFDTRMVAVKTVRQDILSSDDLQEGEAIARFEREAQAAASIQHPNTVSVTDFGETDDGIFYLVMEYVEGETLHRLLRREGTLPVKRAVRLLRQIADGVDAAHDLNILHRDLKPANIFIMQKGKGGDGFVKVGDFGLAKIVNQTITDTSSNATPSSRGIIGTPEFMSPEQMQPEVGVDKRADLYALGTIAYLMLGGKTPFTGDLMQLVMQKIMHKPAPLSSIRSDIPSDVERVIMHALEIEPAQRPMSVAEWIADLESAAEDVDESRRAGVSRLVVLAPVNAEVYVNDERKGSVGSSGRVVLTDIPAGQHILRVSKPGERDDERVIEVRDGANEQVIQAQLRPTHGTPSQPSPSQGSSTGGSPQSSVMPGIVACSNCNSRFAEGVKFCGRCGSGKFVMISPGEVVTSFPCPRCANILPQNSRFCGRCGLNIAPAPQSTVRQAVGFTSGYQNPAPPQAERLCRRCGSVYTAHIKFCGRCGITL